MEKRQLKKVLMPLLIAASIVAGMYIGWYYGIQQAGSNQYIIYPRTDKLTSIINYIARKYVDPVNKDELIEKAIPKILEELDPHSLYIPASEFEQVNEPLEGKFFGIGVQFNMLNDTLIVIKSVANGPSEKVGILPGDRFILVNNDTVAGVKMPSDSIVKRLKGPQGTKVKVGVLRKAVKDIVYFTITRDEIPLYSIDVAYMVSKDIGLIKINTFAITTYDEFTSAVKKLYGKGMQKLILDLRGNGGGLLNIAVSMIDEFLEDGKLIVYTQGNALERENYTSTKGGLCTAIDVVVLMDETSASASEIVAGALQDNDRALIIGRRSFGKGLVQEQNKLSDGSAIRLTIARYYTPTGRCIQKSYSHGAEEYYNELTERFNNGEFMVQDSTQFADSLKFTTPGGRIVYGGGGIMPDIFVPLDTNDITKYYIEIRNRGLIYKYALEYTDSYRKKLNSCKTVDQLEKFLVANKTMKKFIDYATKNGVSENKKDLKASSVIIECQLFAYIARNIFDNDGYYPLLEKIDNTLQVAIKKLDEK